jgi:outer membrane protein assembly factor BamB
VVGSLVFLTAGDATSREVMAFDLETGAPRWTTAIPFGEEPGTALPEVSSDTGFAAATPAADAENVYAVFATGDLAALRHDGTIRWRQSLGVPENPYGHASSLLAHEGMLFVQFDSGHGGRALAIRGNDGTSLWDVEREVETSWASPLLLPREAGPLLVLAAPDTVVAHSLADGSEVWSVEAVSGEVAPSPAVAEGRLFLAQEYSRLVAFDLATTPPAMLWEQFDELPSIASPVAGHGTVWIASSTGVVSAHNAATGELRWRHEFGAGFNASPLLAGDTLLLLDLEGALHLLATGPTFELLATLPLGDAAFATPAVLNDRLVVRTKTKLLLIEGDPLAKSQP